MSINDRLFHQKVEHIQTSKRADINNPKNNKSNPNSSSNNEGNNINNIDYRSNDLLERLSNTVHHRGSNGETSRRLSKKIQLGRDKAGNEGLQGKETTSTSPRNSGELSCGLEDLQPRVNNSIWVLFDCYGSGVDRSKTMVNRGRLFMEEVTQLRNAVQNP